MNRVVKKLGVIVGVDGDISQVGMYHLSNDAEYLWYGDVLQGAKIGAYLTILQNNVKIIASVVTEKVADQQNTIRSTEFDNRFSKNSINRIVHLKTKGVIENGEFQVTSQYVPMIGNEVCITSKKDLELIYGINDAEPTISIGKSILEGQVVPLSINKIFASHVGVFGNTGSGKSNTLHKLYLELFRSEYKEKILEYSKFYVIDFNGEYTKNDSFGVINQKRVFEINTKNLTSTKLPITSDYLFDPDILSILFGATTATQVPFLRKSLKIWNERQFNGESIAHFVVGTLKRILTTGNSASLDSKDNWISIAEKYIDNDLFDVLKSNLHYNYNTEAYYTVVNGTNNYIINPNTPIADFELKYLKIDEIERDLKLKFDSFIRI